MKRRKFSACPYCGSLEFEWVGGGARAVFDFTGASALSGLMHCKKCGKDVFPIEFESEAKYKEFAKSLEGKTAEARRAEEMKAGEKPVEARGVDMAGGYTRANAALATVFGVVVTAYALITVAASNSFDRNWHYLLFLGGITGLCAYLYWRASKKT